MERSNPLPLRDTARTSQPPGLLPRERPVPAASSDTASAQLGARSRTGQRFVSRLSAQTSRCTGPQFAVRGVRSDQRRPSGAKLVDGRTHQGWTMSCAFSVPLKSKKAATGDRLLLGTSSWSEKDTSTKSLRQEKAGSREAASCRRGRSASCPASGRARLSPAQRHGPDRQGARRRIRATPSG